MSPAVPKYAQAAAIVRARVADGTLRPGAPAPSGAALARVTGYSVLTCRKALELLIAQGVLRAGLSPNARPRVTGSGPDDLDVCAAALSEALASRRRAAGMTQAELSEVTGYSVTAVGHAETGRLWQSREFWETAGNATGDAGELARLHDDYSAARSRPHALADAEPSPGTVPAAAPPPAAPVSVTITWPDGTTITVRQPPAR